jgi:protein involved in polysaccharide export with SLBB domain
VTSLLKRGLSAIPAALLLPGLLLQVTGCRNPSPRGPDGSPIFTKPGDPAESGGSTEKRPPGQTGSAPASAADLSAAVGPNAIHPGMTKPGPGARLDPALLKPPTEPYRLGPGDILEIDLVGSDEGPQRTFVGPDGKIYFNLLSGLQVWGYTLEEATRALESGLSTFLQNPKVSLTLREVRSRRIQVMGRVSVPGLYELTQPMTILEALSQARGPASSRVAGATEEMADLQHSFLLRQGRVIPIDFDKLIRQGDTSQNIYLQADDLVFMPSTLGSQIFVLGAVGAPRSIPYKGRTTLVTALASCRGLAPDAKSRQVAIVRGSLQDPSIAIVDAGAILKGKQPDILLSPRDIVYVPARSPYGLRSYVDLIITSFARSLAASAASAATGSDNPVGLSVGP